MSLISDDELSIALCKVGAPLVLFICTPLMTWATWKVFQKDLAAGIQIETKTFVEMGAIILAMLVFGLWMARKGYGWFGGSNSH